MKSQDDTAAVMVLYNPPASLEEAVSSLLLQVKHLILVDNGHNVSLCQHLPASIHWLSNPRNNLGVAQNLGIVKAGELGAKFVLLMDDDSIPAPDMVQKLHAAWHPGIGVIGPYLEEPTLNREPHYIQAAGKYGFHRRRFSDAAVLDNLFYVAASGSLIPLAVIDDIGMVEESFGIYFIDTEFCLRARELGYNIAAAKAARMRHHFGRTTRHRLLRREITTTNHSPQARFLMFRNRKTLWQRYWRTQPGYVLFDMLRAATEILRIALFEDQKRAKFTAILQGLFKTR